jgi:hypothetical protein
MHYLIEAITTPRITAFSGPFPTLSHRRLSQSWPRIPQRVLAVAALIIRRLETAKQPRPNPTICFMLMDFDTNVGLCSHHMGGIATQYRTDYLNSRTLAEPHIV